MIPTFEELGIGNTSTSFYAKMTVDVGVLPGT
jgi:hypothetical protein